MTPPPLEAKVKTPKLTEPNAKLDEAVKLATAELHEAVLRVQKERVNAMQAIQKEAAEAEHARTNALLAVKREEAKLEEVKQEWKSVSDEIKQLKIAKTNVAVATQLQREFIVKVIDDLGRRGMMVQSFDYGRTTNRFMAFSSDDGNLTLGGPTTTVDVDLLIQHREQLNVLLNIIDQWAEKRRKVREFKVIQGSRYGSVLSDQSLTILWPPTSSSPSSKSAAEQDRTR